jgi:hypothetical protein
MSIRYDTHELLELMPTLCTRVETLENGDNQLRALYYLPWGDPGMDWAAYGKWMDSLGAGIIVMPEFPQASWPIYFHTHGFYDVGKVPLDSTAVLYLYMTANTASAHIEFIERNADPRYKGLGAAFFSNLTENLKERGYEWVTAQPLNERLEEFWKSRGFEREGQCDLYHYNLR